MDPPGEGNALSAGSDAPAALRQIEHELAHEAPLVNPWFCITFLIITVAIMAATAEFVWLFVHAPYALSEFLHTARGQH